MGQGQVHASLCRANAWACGVWTRACVSFRCVACGRAAADGRLYEGEIALLAEIRDQLNIARLHAAAIELSAQVRHRVI